MVDGDGERLAQIRIRLDETRTRAKALEVAPGRSGHKTRLRDAQADVRYWERKLDEALAPLVANAELS